MLYGWICMCFGMMMPCCTLRCMLVCMWVRIQVLNMILLRLRHKMQWWEANFRVEWSWVPNTFPRMYLNSEPISLVVRLMVIPWKDATLMVLRPLQKLCGDSSVMSTIAQLVSSIIHGSNSLSFSYQIIF